MQIEISEQDDFVYDIAEGIQAIFNNGILYIMSESGFFTPKSINLIQKVDENTYIYAEGEEKLILNREQYDKVYDALAHYNSVDKES
jgi:hypothetical protein